MQNTIDVNVINPFIQAAISCVGSTTQINLKTGSPSVKQTFSYDESTIVIIVSVTGAMSGQIIFSIPIEHAKQIASGMMMGMPVPELDEMSLSAISELGNITMGTAATILSTSDILVDITTPMLQRGNALFSNVNTPNICVPLLKDDKPYMELNIIIKRKA